ncbi:MAG: septum formation inhibitor Maf [Methylococcaceae bacterium]|nr:MAG: septum formation inhibitor Maf [Methylococcaceae bacterium]
MTQIPHPPSLVLASGSTYRRQLLSKLGLAFECAAPDVDESRRPGEAAMALAGRLAESKARALAEVFPAHLIIGSDQVACVDGRLLGKPGGRAGAIQQLQLVQGKPVRFYTGLYVFNSREQRGLAEMDVTTVHFRPLSTQQIEAYVDREQPYDCAGGFKSESLGIALFDRIEGEDPNALVGLPLIRLVRLLEPFGVEVL